MGKRKERQKFIYRHTIARGNRNVHEGEEEDGEKKISNEGRDNREEEESSQLRCAFRESVNTI